MSTETIAPLEALWRAMSEVRMLDYGMDYADVLLLQQSTAAGTAWDVACEQLGRGHADRAGAAVRDGHPITAYEEYRAGMVCLMFAQMAFNFDGARKRELYGQLDELSAAAAALATPSWERIDVPFAGGSMAGWLIRRSGPPTGTVIVFGGQSGWGTAYAAQAAALNRRGLAAFLVEGPGQGQTRLTGGIMLDVDVRAAYRAFVDVVLDRRLGPVGLWGNSVGGLFAGTAAAADRRVAAVCVNGAPAKPRLLTFRTFAEQAAAMLGTSDTAQIQENFDRIALRDDDRIECPLLVLHGGVDPIVSLADQQPFLDAAVDGFLRVWPDGEHTIYNHSTERSAVVADWFVDRLGVRR